MIFYGLALPSYYFITNLHYSFSLTPQQIVPIYSVDIRNFSFVSGEVKVKCSFFVDRVANNCGFLVMLERKIPWKPFVWNPFIN